MWSSLLHTKEKNYFNKKILAREKEEEQQKKTAYWKDHIIDTKQESNYNWADVQRKH